VVIGGCLEKKAKVNVGSVLGDDGIFRIQSSGSIISSSLRRISLTSRDNPESRTPSRAPNLLHSLFLV
jgi:hypothetical protein